MLLDEDQEVGDDETLYRAVKHGLGRIKQLNGELKTSSDCFLDPSYEVSVDRAKLCGFDPTYTQVSSTDYVFHLLARDVRGIKKVTRNGANGNPVDCYAIDVRADPLLDKTPPNPAHAVIFANPQIFPSKDRRIFSRLKESLAQIAVWEEGLAPSAAN